MSVSLPDDGETAVLVGRIWDPTARGPRVVAVRGDRLVDLSDIAPTVSSLFELEDPASLVDGAISQSRMSWDLSSATHAALAGDDTQAMLLSPIDLQVIKACGVTFADSMLERLIEERAAGDPTKAVAIRSQFEELVNSDRLDVVPGSPAALRLRESMQQQGLWSPYLEVGIGPYPEVFTKAPVLSSVGHGAAIGIPSFSSWNNPEPELVLLVNSAGRVVGATLGNDVNLRDIEGRSALLLGMAKDSTASTAIGPFIRLFDTHLGGAFDIESLRSAEIELTVEGADGFVLHGRNSLARISRSFESLVAATIGSHHQYPDGFALFTGTLFAPTDDRDEVGLGFTHKIGDVVTISSPQLGTLRNTVHRTEELPEWTFGISALLAHLQRESSRAMEGGVRGGL